MDDPTEQIPVPLNAAESLARLGAMHAAATATLANPVELYHRQSASVRVERAPAAKQVEVQTGREQGLALRVHDRVDGSTVFVAASGGDPSTVDWLVSRARQGYGHRRILEGEEPWDRSEDRVADTDPEARLPAPSELTRWIDVALGSLPDDGAPTVGVRVEVGISVESWVASGGRKASRSRIRAWAVAESTGGPPWAGGPMILASRSWDRLAADGWATLAADRVWPSRGVVTELPAAGIVLFSPETSATLVAALVAAVHAPDAVPDVPAGPGWRLRDDPLADGAILGGAFDDACFDSRPRWLADGRSVVGLVGGPGSWRRASYRDVPREMPAHLVLDPPSASLPTDAVLVTGLRVHALAPGDWLLEFRGGVVRGGGPGPGITQGSLRVAPADLVARCVAGFGEGRRSWNGVETPALIFDGLRPVLFDRAELG